MRPRYCCLYLRQELRTGLVLDPGAKRTAILLPDGETLRKRPSDLLWQWEGTPLPPCKDEHARRSAALAQLRHHADPPPELGRWLDRLRADLSGQEPRRFESILENDPTRGSLPPDAKENTGETAWRHAHLFMGMLSDARHFRYVRGAISLRAPEEVAAWEARQEEAEEQEHWSALAADWRERLDAGNPLPDDHPDAAVFLERLRSLLAREKRSPYWGLLARPLGLHQLNSEDLALRLKTWLTTAGAWPDWPAVWLDWGEVPTEFPAGLEEVAQTLAAAPFRNGKRRDFTALDTFSIDSAETLDIDDAVSILPGGRGGMTVAVHIAEPDPALLPGHPLFDEAARRMATAYTLSGIFPMFPPSLSTDRFSLKAGEPRETLSFVLRLQDGNPELLEVVPGLVRLSGNLDFAFTQGLLDAQPSTWGRLAQHCAELAEARGRRGAVLMERRATRLDIGDPEHIRIFEVVRTGPVHQIVEELAIAYNAAAGDYCSRHGLPAVYRVQPVSPLGLESSGLAEERPTTPPARFTTQPDHHAGLGCTRYIQATSPIRRFLDLVMQRQIADHATGNAVTFPDSDMLEAWAHTAEGRMSQIDDTARRIEEDWKRRYLQQNPGMEMEATVRRREGATGRVWLEPLRMSAQCEFPEETGEEERIRVRIMSVDRDRRQVWCKGVG